MRTARTTLASLLAAAMLAGGAMAAAAQVPIDDGSPTRLSIDITIAGADEVIQVAVDDADGGLTRLVTLTPAVLAQLEALEIEYPYLGLHDGVQIGRDHGRLAEFADRFPYMATEQ